MGSGTGLEAGELPSQTSCHLRHLKPRGLSWRWSRHHRITVQATMSLARMTIGHCQATTTCHRRTIWRRRGHCHLIWDHQVAIRHHMDTHHTENLHRCLARPTTHQQHRCPVQAQQRTGQPRWQCTRQQRQAHRRRQCHLTLRTLRRSSPTSIGPSRRWPCARQMLALTSSSTIGCARTSTYRIFCCASKRGSGTTRVIRGAHAGHGG
mmetsp:Transcript_44329/g.77832  ORF Transcript_44329/g.77832 Transcript_44329/m.77832 type:complete len:208 (+) Transcript_44329:105-728(+)